jgi:hypothetical protein
VTPYDAAAAARAIVQHMMDTMSPTGESHEQWCDRFAAEFATALTAAYENGAAAHVEHHRCERCYAAGMAAERARWESTQANRVPRDAPRGT